MNASDEYIREYKEIYNKIYGKLPLISKKGAWIYIDNYSTAFRASDLPKMGVELLSRYLKSQVYEAKKVHEKIWKKNIKKDLIESFLDKLYQKCNNSVYEMEEYMKAFSWGDIDITCNNNDYSYKREIFDLKKEKNEYLNKLKHHKEWNKLYKKEINKLKKLIEKLKENSVFFSMDDYD